MKKKCEIIQSDDTTLSQLEVFAHTHKQNDGKQKKSNKFQEFYHSLTECSPFNIHCSQIVE